MKINFSKPVKSVFTKVFTVTLLAVFLFAGSSLTAVLTQQKAVEAAQKQASNWSQPYDEHVISLLRNIGDFQNFSDDDKQLLFDYFGLVAPLSDEELACLAAQDEQPQTISAEAILLDILEGRASFDTISAADWAKVENYFNNFDSKQLNALTHQGYTARDIYQINWVVNTGLFSISEAELLLELYPNTDIIQLVFEFYVCSLGSEPTVKENAKTQLLSGMDFDDIKDALCIDAENN
ncbi:MAG: hypothetical protein FWF98_04660, partial [Dehalococcoidia bacterium]|nr:hypothetical protein [Dehalococcoidia bacterium]